MSVDPVWAAIVYRTAGAADGARAAAGTRSRRRWRTLSVRVCQDELGSAPPLPTHLAESRRKGPYRLRLPLLAQLPGYELV